MSRLPVLPSGGVVDVQEVGSPCRRGFDDSHEGAGLGDPVAGGEVAGIETAASGGGHGFGIEGDEGFEEAVLAEDGPAGERGGEEGLKNS